MQYDYSKIHKTDVVTLDVHPNVETKSVKVSPVTVIGLGVFRLPGHSPFLSEKPGN